MIKQHTELRTVECSIADDVLCNKCGRSIMTTTYPDATSGRLLPVYTGVDLTTRWGYSSTKDMTTTIAHICEACYDAFAETFEIPIERHDPL